MVALDHANSTVISILPTASSGYQISPPFSSRLQVNSSGQLVSAGELKASDAGMYMINSSNFSGTLSLVVRVSSKFVIEVMYNFTPLCCSMWLRSYSFWIKDGVP